jgi:hypothetical protein
MGLVMLIGVCSGGTAYVVRIEGSTVGVAGG